MDMMSTGRFALRLRAPAWRVKRLATLLFTLLLLSYHWGLPTYSATSSLPAPQRNADSQAVNALTPRLFYPTVYYGYRDSSRTWNSTLTVQNHANTSATVELVFYNENVRQQPPPASRPPAITRSRILSRCRRAARPPCGLMHNPSSPV